LLPADYRQVINGIAWVKRTGAPWRDLSERCGPWKTCYERFRMWAAAVTWARMKRAQTSTAAWESFLGMKKRYHDCCNCINL